MSILESIFGGLFGDDDTQGTTTARVEHPCQNCPSNCQLYPNACSVCQPYKEQMIDALYWVEHKDELKDQYEVVGVNNMNSGSTVCPYCGGPSNDPYICEYCGSQLQEGTGKIRVASAADIPNPVLNAQDIIFDRYHAVSGFAGADSAYGLEGALSGINSEGLLSSIFNALMGSDTSTESVTIGNKMTEKEIESMADFYDVSVSEYLDGLDNGKFFTLSNKDISVKAEETYVNSQSSSDDSLFGLGGLGGGLAGAMGLGSLLFGGNKYNKEAAKDYKPNYSYSYTRPQSYDKKPAPIMPTTVNQKKVASSARKTMMAQHKQAASALPKAGTPVMEKKVTPVQPKKVEPVIEKKSQTVKVEPVLEKKSQTVKVEPVIEKKTTPVAPKKVEPVVEKKVATVQPKKVETVIEKKPQVKKVEPVVEKKPAPLPPRNAEPAVEKKTVETPKKETVHVVNVSSENDIRKDGTLHKVNLPPRPDAD